jgi:ubiquinone/menaquinone biosynthesis C-methylase UbiE
VLIEKLLGGSAGAVLEVGCGPGALARRLADEHAIAVTAIDISERMVQLARPRGIDAAVCDVQSLPFPDESFDCAIAAWMLYHVPDLDQGLREISRLLRPGRPSDCRDQQRAASR